MLPVGKSLHERPEGPPSPMPMSARLFSPASCAAPPAQDLIQVDPEFSSLIPPLSREEYQHLEVRLLREGCLDALIVWKGTNILLDGHYRLALCRKHNIPFGHVLLEMPDRTAARSYIVGLQLGRRNISCWATAYAIGKRYEAEKQPHGGQRTSDEQASGDEVQLSTAQRLALEYKVNERTIRRDERFAQAVDAIVEHCGVEMRTLILSRDAGLTRRQVLRISRLDPEEQKKYIQTLKEQGKPPRRKRDTIKYATITLPREPKSFVETLVKRWGRDSACEVLTILSELLAAKCNRAN